ncbi:leukocyte elastase inhibitor-like [Spea bombifrons]|uniref:leukocyte elastase inhibitor-like n=1 Tax=Spea bombifrons TaxID=233779 RepID=UPI00234B9A68|nr:leukocyte elastase inhibitor-like [Spea bombifrons]
MEKLASTGTQFSFELFREINESNQGNVFFSPFSISAALGMVVLGAKGKTAEQISKTMHVDDNKDFQQNFQSLSAKINKKADSSYVLNLANRLFGEKTSSVLPEFISSIQSLYKADLGIVDFMSSPNAARKEINSWVSEETKGKIPELLAEGSVDETTKLVLANAIYFKGDWAEKFNPKETTEKPFNLNKNEQKMVKMMYQMKKFPFAYIPDINCRILELPYAGKDISMIIMLPDTIDDDTTGLQKLENELTVEKFQEWTKSENMSLIDVHVHLPKFKLEDTYKLKSKLTSMGIVDLFNPGCADLSGISGSSNLFLSDFVHKSFVEVNEEGTEAAAATAGIAMVCMLMEEEFNANHPFLFLIRNNTTKSILFLGRFVSP